jgi:hypothetical protein
MPDKSGNMKISLPEKMLLQIRCLAVIIEKYIRWRSILEYKGMMVMMMIMKKV